MLPCPPILKPHLEKVMARELETYAMVKALYDRGTDYMDAFWPLVLIALSELGGAASYQEVQRTLKDNASIQIPQNSLKALAARARKRGYIDIKQNKLLLTEKARDGRHAMEDQSDAKSRIEDLLCGAKAYIETKTSKELTSGDVESLVANFLRENIALVSCFISTRKCQEERSSQTEALKENEKFLFEYFRSIESTDLEKTLKDMICGSIIAATVYSASFGEKAKAFGATTLFLDTSFLLSALGLDFDEFSLPAKELLSLIKTEKNFQLKVFDFTLDELVSVLRGYSAHYYRYFDSIRVSSVYSSLRTKGYTPTTIRQLVTSLESKLNDLGISVVATQIELGKCDPDESKMLALAKFKPSASRKSLMHDLTAVEEIRRFRGRRVRRPEDAGYYFLSSDIRLTRYCMTELEHKDNATICEVIPDRVLTNVLWLKDPKLVRDLPLSAIVSIHSAGLLIDRSVWDRFIDVIQDLYRGKLITDKDVVILIYDIQMDDALKGLSRDDLDTITKDSVLGDLEQAKQRLKADNDRELQAEIERKEKQYRDQLDVLEDQMAQKSLRREEELQRKLDEARRSIFNASKREGKIIFFAGLFLVAIVLFLGILYLQDRFEGQVLAQKVLGAGKWILSILPTVSGASIKGIRETCTNAIAARRYKRKLEKYCLADENDGDHV
jgi:hypothetical protein